MTLSLSVFSYIHLCLTMVIAIKLLFYYFTKTLSRCYILLISLADSRFCCY